MLPAAKSACRRHRGVALIISMIFVLIFSALAVSMAAMSDANAHLASNQHKVNLALAAAQSGLDCAKYAVSTLSLPETGHNFVSDLEAHAVWDSLCAHLCDMALDGKAVPSPSRFSDLHGCGDQILTSSMNFDSSGTDFTIRFYRYDGAPHTIKVRSIGTNGEAARQVNIEMKIAKDAKVLNYAIASRGRMWLTGNTTINGDLFSSWNRPEISPYNMTSDATVMGTINTVLDLDDIKDEGYQLETLDINDNPIFDEEGNRIYSEEDEVKAYHENINYEQPYEDMPGMDIADYDTDIYNSGLTSIPPCPEADKEVEYFPHASGDYSMPRDGTPSSTWNRRLNRHVYEDQTFTDARLPDDYNALFRNCTFRSVLYIDCYKSGSTKYNNVRFEDCTFEGTIITDVPQVFKWQNNALYFTGEATFNNESGIEEATILAPHFNVNLGNTNPAASEHNVLTGAVVGGIVDVRGNAQIYGTIISMCDTTAWSSGYVTNIGATLDDGGSETTELGDIGVITITPEEDKMLPSGIKSPIVIKPVNETYSEGS
ncbi:MAG: hypothetical protein JW720_05000 [Sedimentisphaerales bacterium]|nr:hypothetical protein [Sedimentisphaerales bacterium]